MSARAHAITRMERDRKAPAPHPDQEHFISKGPDTSFGISNAVRKVAFGTKGSASETVLLTTTGRECHCESGLEAQVVRILDVDFEITDISEQATRFTDEHGKISYPDFLVKETDGTTTMISVKPWAKGIRPEFQEYLRDLERSMISFGTCDRVFWIHEFDVPEILRHNADVIRRARRFSYEDILLDDIEERLKASHTRVHDLASVHPIAVEAAWWLVGSGIAVPSDATPRLDFETVLVPPRGRVCTNLRFDFSKGVNRRLSEHNDRGVVA